jgi:predicted Zn finger-like uncharacterized protein
MAIRITCPSCRQSYNIDENLRGKKVRCAGCQNILAVPAGDSRIMAEKPRPNTAAPVRFREEEKPAPRRRPAAEDWDDEEDDRPRRGKSRPSNNQTLLVFAATAGGVVLLGVFIVLIALVATRNNNPTPPPAMPPAPAPQMAAAPAPFAPASVAPPPPPRVEVPSGPAPGQIDLAVVQKVKQATVYLRVHLPNGGIAQGSGFFCMEPGLVLTNAHVLGMLRSDSTAPANVEVVMHSGQPNEIKTAGTVIGVDRSNDLAMLRVSGNQLPEPLPVDSANKLVETQKVYIFGFPLGSSLGKQITISESSVSALRRDDTGTLAQVQVNGGMHPGNSGGPVADTRGVVIGVSVAGIQGTSINFAIPGDLVKQALDGGFSKSELGIPFRTSGQTTLPITAACLDPLGRIRDVRAEVWTGPAGKERPAAIGHAPAPVPGDSSRQTVALSPRDGRFVGDIPLPSLGIGQVYWIQPVLVNAAGVSVWDAAQSVSLDKTPVVDRMPTTIQYKPPMAPIERTLKLNGNTTLSIFAGTKTIAIGQKMEGAALESLKPDPRGIGTFVQLTLGPCPFTVVTPDEKSLTIPLTVQQMVAQFSPTFLVAPDHACKERGKRNFNVVPGQVREIVEQLYEKVCNTFEATTLPVPNRSLQPLETWPARLPMFVVVQEKGKDKRAIQDMVVTCTYEGVRSTLGRKEAFVSLTGVVKGRGARANLDLGKVKGSALFDVDLGYLTQVNMTVNTEVEVEDSDVRILVTQESTVNRTNGNSLGMIAATQFQPQAPAAGAAPQNRGAMPPNQTPRPRPPIRGRR